MQNGTDMEITMPNPFCWLEFIDQYLPHMIDLFTTQGWDYTKIEQFSSPVYNVCIGPLFDKCDIELVYNFCNKRQIPFAVLESLSLPKPGPSGCLPWAYEIH